MSACFSSIFFLFSFLFTCSAYQHSSIDPTFIDDVNRAESPEEAKWQSNDDELLAQFKSHRAAYQHEQDLLAKIYSPDRTYISLHDGRLYPTNFTYFTFNQPGTYRFILITSHGDADLYVSTRNKHVTYNDYEYSSCTCGIDEVLIDARVKRPIHIGVYGYSQYRPSDYRLLIELVSSKVRSDETDSFSRDDDEESSDTDGQDYNSHANSKPTSTVVEGESHTSHILWDIFVGLLEILEALL